MSETYSQKLERERREKAEREKRERDEAARKSSDDSFELVKYAIGLPSTYGYNPGLFD